MTSFDLVAIQEANPNSRFTVVAMPILSPGTCVLCKSPGGDDRAFIDFGFTLEWFGAIYFCTMCIGEAATLIGMAFKSDWVEAEQYLQTEVSNADSRFVEAKVKLDAAMVLVRDCTCADSGIGDRTSPIAESEPESSDDPVPEPEPSDPNESDADEFAAVEGSDDVPATSDGLDEPVAPKRTRKSTG